MRRLSFIIPVKDEQDTLNDLTSKIVEVVGKLDTAYELEIIFIDDGSKDKSLSVMTQLVDDYQNQVYAIRLRRNFGKATALEAGFGRATGEIVFTMDADLQDDP
ncbi:MAG: glycosyltransferase, partial [Gammaproteobacteria bacterium]|nr:glycosyltransferase [Gammaproteobacteria bacterium]